MESFASTQGSGSHGWGAMFGLGAAPSPPALQVSGRQMLALRRSLIDAFGMEAAAAAPPLVTPFGFGAGAGEVGVPGRGGKGPAVEVLPLKDLYGTEYIGALSVGTTANGAPSADLRVVYDTGSADLWVSSDLCTKWPCGGPNRKQYDHRRSRTFRKPETPMNLSTTYGSGGLQGTLGVDDVRVGPLLARGQTLGLIAEESGPAFEMLPFDGIVGLAFPSLAVDPAMSLVGRLASQGSLARQEFAFYLHRDPTLGGGVLWGGVDERLYTGELLWFPVAEQLYWELDLLAFRVGDAIFDFANSSAPTPRFSRKAPASAPLPTAPRLIVDSGTTFFTAEGDIYAAIMKRVHSAPCGKFGSLPALVYTVRDCGGRAQEIFVPPEEYMVDAGRDSAGSCFPAVVYLSGLGSRPAMILGEVFMRNYFTVFSAVGPSGAAGPVGTATPAVGIARAKFDREAAEFFKEAAAATAAATGEASA